MSFDEKDGLTDVADNLPSSATPPSNQSPGTVIAADGSEVTLGDKPLKVKSVSYAKESMNSDKPLKVVKISSKNQDKEL